MKFTLGVEIKPAARRIAIDEPVLLLGSCFSDSIAARMKASGMPVCANPFGTLYNPESIASALERLESGRPFGEADCMEMGSGAGKICSFHHHTSFARESADAFLQNANASLLEAAGVWKQSRVLIVTLGTAMVWRRLENGEAVANCLKRPGGEFTHEMLSVAGVSAALRRIIALAGGRSVIFTVSPVRHPGEGLHRNSLSKATLLLGLEEILPSTPGATYFPAYEIVLDELRDYRFFAEDFCHPSKIAADYVWERFCDGFLTPEDKEKARLLAKRALSAGHIPFK
ncbi:MAG: GSCFA domain-containing protein [Bacteroidales bacterium]|nr:GSCFA domain-containing protein [Bacteroidales bacterium]